MKITNKHNVPQTLVTLATKEYYSKGAAQYSVTELMGPPRIRRLRERYADQMEQDVSDMLWQMLGSALHVVMERGQTPNHITEERLFATLDGVTISGAIDLQEETPFGVVITDYKFTSAWAVMNSKREWIEQLNIYCWLVETVKKKKVVGLNICALIRDWSRHETKEGYPKASIEMVPIEIWPLEKTEAYLKERINLHTHARAVADLGGEFDHCTPEDRWMSETTFAVRREGRKTAIRVFKSKEEAEALAAIEKGFVETRPGEPRRCLGDYCGVAKWCDQFNGATE